MPPVRIAIVRHSKSCANHVRNVAGTDEQLVAASQTLRDPALSAVGERMARAYGPLLRSRLTEAGFTVPTAHVMASHLRRAQQTANLLFGRQPQEVPHMTEHGAIPENTPAGSRYLKPNWTEFLRHLAADYPGGGEFIVVSHGSFLRTHVWPAVSGRRWSGHFNNLDAFVVTGDLQANGHIRSAAVRVIRYTGSVKPDQPDQCALPAKVAALTKMVKRRASKRRSTRRQRRLSKHRQRGGATPMPLAFYKDGAQMQGTSGTPTGVGIGGTSASWAREAIQQTGGRRRTHRQAGGWSPSVMGAFAQNGLQFLPSLAAYTGYKMWKGSRRQ